MYSDRLNVPRPPKPGTITPRRLGAKLGVTSRWVRYLINQGRIAARRDDDGNWVLTPSAAGTTFLNWPLRKPDPRAQQKADALRLLQGRQMVHTKIARKVGLCRSVVGKIAAENGLSPGPGAPGFKRGPFKRRGQIQRAAESAAMLRAAVLVNLLHDLRGGTHVVNLHGAQGTGKSLIAQEAIKKLGGRSVYIDGRVNDITNARAAVWPTRASTARTGADWLFVEADGMSPTAAQSLAMRAARTGVKLVLISQQRLTMPTRVRLLYQPQDTDLITSYVSAEVPF